jgi:Flp pilus assembly protein TadB
METLGTLAAIVGALGLVAIIAAAILPDPDTERRRRIAERMERNRETSRNRRIGGGR